MRLTLGDYGITVAMKDTFGKRPGLYVENRNYNADGYFYQDVAERLGIEPKEDV